MAFASSVAGIGMPKGAARQPTSSTGSGMVADLRRLSPCLLLFAFSVTLLPEETSLFIAGIRVTIGRALLICVFPYCMSRILREIRTGKYRFVWSDAYIFPAAIWMFLAVSITEGIDRGIIGAGVTALEFLGAYIIARSLLVVHGDALRLARWLAILLAVVGILAPLDTFAGRHIIHDTIGSLTGYEPPYQIDVRRGLLRSAGLLEHPILLGTACAFGMLLSMTLPLRIRVFVLLGTATGLIVSVSSAPLCSMIIGFACLAYRRFTPGFEARWRALGGCCVFALALLFTFHPAPVGWLIGHTTFEPTSGYYRLLTWHYAGELVLNAPVFGIGMSDNWSRPDWMLPTVDTLWLRSAMSFGIPGSVLIAACLIGACSRRVDIAAAHLSPAERQLGVTLSLIQFLYIFIGFTTSFWGTTWILMGLFAGMRAHLGALGAIKPPSSRPQRRRI